MTSQLLVPAHQSHHTQFLLTNPTTAGSCSPGVLGSTRLKQKRPCSVTAEEPPRTQPKLGADAAVGNGASAFHSTGKPFEGSTRPVPIIPTVQVHEELLLSLPHKLIPKFIYHKPINGKINKIEK